MDAGTAAATGSGSKTMADLVAAAASKHESQPALRHKVGDEWVDITYGELGEAVREVGLGLIDLGMEHGDKVAILSHTRPDWTFANFGIMSTGAVSVSIYQTNSPEECHYVLEHSESRAVFVEDTEQLEKVRAVRDRLPKLEHIVIFDPADGNNDRAQPAEPAASRNDDAISLADLRARGAARDAAELERRTDAVTDDDVCVMIYTSGTTGPPKGCLISHGNYRATTSLTTSMGTLEEGESVYLFLPLAHAFAKLIQFVSVDLGGTLAYWQKDAARIVPDLMETHPTYFPSVPRMFEKIYTMATTAAPDRDKLDAAVKVGLEVRQLQDRGEDVPAELQEAFDAAEESLYKNVRGLFGGRIRQCTTGAAPIAREILEFFYACGVPVMEGYGMTETSTVASTNRPDAFRFGSVGKLLPGVEAKVADDGELLLRGPNIFKGYYKNEDATGDTLVDGWLHTGDLGRIDDDGFLYIIGRKKDIIITAGGKNITPANLENGLKQNRWVSQAVVVGDRRPYLIALITLDPEEVPAFAEQHGLEPEEVAGSEQMRAEIQQRVDEVNATVGPVEQIKRFRILPHDLAQETGELTPTLKVKRNVVNDKFADVVEDVYAG
jgi:long-chain acyl-CoA synthetase